jgi:hypothetical protein
MGPGIPRPAPSCTDTLNPSMMMIDRNDRW